MKPRVREAIEIAGVVVMQMGDDDVLDGVGGNAEIRQRIDRIERQLAGARLRLFGVEAGIDQDVAAAARGSARRNNRGPAPWSRADRGPENSCGGCAATSSHSAARRFRRHFPSVSLFSWMFGLADPGNKPSSSAKVKRGARMTAARQRSTLCETDHIAAMRREQCAFGAAISRRTAAYWIRRRGRTVMRKHCRPDPEPFAPTKSQAVVLPSQTLLFLRPPGPVAVNCRN